MRLIEALLLCAYVRVGLYFVRWHGLRRERAPRLRVDADEPVRVRRAIRRAARLAPFRCNCLVRALVGERMLRRRGFDARIRFGVRRGGPRAIEAHAWLECGGRVAVGSRHDFAALGEVA